MVYTIKINDNTQKAKSIINMLKALRDDYKFIEIAEDSNAVEAAIDKELEARYQLFLQNPTGKDWDQLQKELR